MKWYLKWFRFPLVFFFNYETDKEPYFSTKKFYAFIFSTLGVINLAWLFFIPKSHWSVIVANNGVSSTVIVTILGSIDVLVMTALGIYGWTKIAEKKMNGGGKGK